MADSITTGSHGASREGRWSVGVGAATVCLLAWRVPEAISRFWAEDGTIFFQGALDGSGLAPFLDGYAGYAHFVPRLIALASASVPIHQAAYVTWLGVGLMVAWSAATVFRRSVEWIHNPVARATVALSLAAIPPLRFESIANSANLQFTLLFASLAVLVSSSVGRWSQVNGCALLLITGLTTPLAIVLMPLVVFRAVMLAERQRFLEIGSWTLGLFIQSWQMLGFQPGNRLTSPSNILSAIEPFIVRVVGSTFLPAAGATSASILSIGLFVLFVGAAVTCWRTRDRPKAVLLILVPAVGLCCYAGLAVLLGQPPRYRPFPAWCVFFAFVAATEVALARVPRTVARTLIACTVIIVGLAWYASWTPVEYRTRGMAWSESLAPAVRACTSPTGRSAGQHVEVQVLPYPPSEGPWVVRIPCSRLH